MTRRLLLVWLVALLFWGCTSAPPVPEGWAEAEAVGLTFVHPGSWGPTPGDLRTFPEAAVEVSGSADEGLAPMLAAFGYEGAMEDVNLRAIMITNRMRAQLEAQLIADHELQVPGTVAGRVLEFAFDAEDGDGRRVPSLQYEVMLTGDDGLTWDMVIGGPADQMRHGEIQTILRSLRVT
jgi:hypothetical protein